MRYAKHIFRLGLLLIFVIAATVIVLRLFVPESFGKYGNYRADNLKEQMAIPVVWEGSKNDACIECHKQNTFKKMASRHKNVPCMNCHGPITEHVKDNKRIAAMTISKSWKNCARCHQKLAARAHVVPQVDVVEHLKDNGVTIEENVCIQCHNPHAPKPE